MTETEIKDLIKKATVKIEVSVDNKIEKGDAKTSYRPSFGISRQLRVRNNTLPCKLF